VEIVVAAKQRPALVRFDCYEVDLRAGRLSKRGIRINLREQPFQILMALLERPGEVVTRDHLRRQLWPKEVFVDFDNNLNTAIARLREALCDSADHPHFIETLPRRGYRFLAEVHPVSSLSAEVVGYRVRLLVLPFVNLSGDLSEEYFSDALTDEIITAIAALSPDHLGVIARTTAMRYKGSQKDVEQIGHELAVDYIVEGGVRRAEDRIAINVQLIQVQDQTHLFARKYNAEMREVFKLQSSIAQSIAAQVPGLAGKLPLGIQEDGGRVRRATENLVAYNEYIQGRYEMAKMTVDSLAAARKHLGNAVAGDPEFGLAYDALAETYWYLGYLGFVAPRQAASAGIVHALRAIEIDSSRAETHALLGEFHRMGAYNWEEVEREMALARQLDRNSPLVRMRYALACLMPHNRMEEAAAELEALLELDPLSLVGRFWLAIALLLANHYEQGIEEGRKLLAIDPNYYLGYFAIGVGHRSQGKFAEAVAFHRKAVELAGGTAGTWGWLGLSLGLAGEADEARAVLRRLHEMAVQGYVPPSSFAWVYLGLGEMDTAFEWLNRAVEVCDQFLMQIKSYPFLEPIRADPRFAELVRKMNLEPQT
jgi:TolB-like protein/Flp pilus assembly protein TadD